MPNHVVHFAIHADDVERAKTFYATAFGWTFEPWGPPNFYNVRTGEGGIMGALEKRQVPLSGTGVRAFRDSFVDSAQHRFPLFARPLPINGVAFRPNPCTCIESGDATPLSPDTLPLPFLTLFLAFALVRRARGSVVQSPFGLAIVRSIV